MLKDGATAWRGKLVMLGADYGAAAAPLTAAKTIVEPTRPAAETRIISP